MTTAKVVQGRSLQEDAWLRLKKNKVALFSGYFIVVVCAIAFVAQWIAPFAFDEQFLDRVLISPNSQHLLGTDSLGRDMLSRLIYGARVSMAVGVITALISLGIGLVYGAVA